MAKLKNNPIIGIYKPKRKTTRNDNMLVRGRAYRIVNISSPQNHYTIKRTHVSVETLDGIQLRMCPCHKNNPNNSLWAWYPIDDFIILWNDITPLDSKSYKKGGE